MAHPTYFFLASGRARAAATMLVATLSACTATSAPTASPAATEWPLLVRLAQATSDPAEVVRRTQAVAGVPVRYRAASSPVWHAVALSCPTAQRCEQALQALRQSPTIVTVEVDRPVAVPAPPTPSTAF